MTDEEPVKKPVRRRRVAAPEPAEAPAPEKKPRATRARKAPASAEAPPPTEPIERPARRRISAPRATRGEPLPAEPIKKPVRRRRAVAEAPAEAAPVALPPEPPPTPAAASPTEEAPRSDARPAWERRRRRGGRRRGQGRTPAEVAAEGVSPQAEGEAAERQPALADEGTEGIQPYDRHQRRRRRGRGRRAPQVPLTASEQAALEARRAAEAAAKEERRRLAEQQRLEAQRRKVEREAARRAQQQAQQAKRQRKRPPAFGETWWSKRWTAVLETFGWAARVYRGAEYARAGAVTDLAMDEYGVVLASVQGSRPEPYRVELSLAHLPAEAWDAVLAEMSRSALLAAQLLAGEMPQDIEEVFFDVGVTLFPYDGQEIYADCDCPDEVNPCKHIAAVFYTLAQEFDRDPFLIFRFRGRSREQVAACLRALRAEAGTIEEEEPVVLEPETKALEQCLDHFWRAGEDLEGLRLQIAPPVTPGAVLMRLGQPNGWDGARGFIFTMAPYYQALSERALAAAYAESGGEKVEAIPI